MWLVAQVFGEACRTNVHQSQEFSLVRHAIFHSAAAD